MKSSKMTTTLKTVLCAALVSVLGACASGPSVKTEKSDKAAAERAKPYVEGMKGSSSEGLSASMCAIPSGVEKSTAGVSGPSRDWKDLANRASACAAKGDWRTLEVLGNHLARLDVDSPWGAYYLSLAAEARGEWARSAWMIELAQKKAGKPVSLFFYQRGRLFLSQGESGKAVAEFRKAVDLDPDLMHAHLHLATVLHRDMEWKAAAKHYEAVLAKDTKNRIALVGLADIRYADGQSQEAGELYQRAVAVDANDLHSWIRMCSSYEKAKNSEHALNAYKGLRRSMEQGKVKGKLDFDIEGKIKVLEESVRAARQPAKAEAKPES